MNTNKTQAEQLPQDAVICRLFSNTLSEPLEYKGAPIYYKMNGRYGYLIPSAKNVIWFYSEDGIVFYEELENWYVLTR